MERTWNELGGAIQTGNWELETGNWELGTGKWEMGKGKREMESRERGAFKKAACGLVGSGPRQRPGPFFVFSFWQTFLKQ